MEEEVLVFPAILLDQLGPFAGFTGDVDRYLPSILDPAHLSYLPRSLAEDDPTHKQLIPYVVLRCQDQVFCYARGRAGGESRLHDRLSLGVGGHICREDGDRGLVAYETGFARELAEEVHIDAASTSRVAGLLYDPTTPVGRVHVGVVHLFELTSPTVRAVDPSLADGRFWTLAEIRSASGRLENWSALVLDHLLSGSEGT
jgi:predicted NUDIX family phosphoesterase